jgi:hypothetical protein
VLHLGAVAPQASAAPRRRGCPRGALARAAWADGVRAQAVYDDYCRSIAWAVADGERLGWCWRQEARRHAHLGLNGVLAIVKDRRVVLSGYVPSRSWRRPRGRIDRTRDPLPRNLPGQRPPPVPPDDAALMDQRFLAFQRAADVVWPAKLSQAYLDRSAAEPSLDFSAVDRARWQDLVAGRVGP